MAHWWQETTIYQIYPRSFCDADGDGIGDLRGIIERLDYVKDLGFETIWISPFYPSPLADHGYDITDYRGVAPEYGTLADVEELLEEAHRRDLKILLDMVLGHTSDQHPWFIESRASRENAESDWYIWHEGRGKKPPNNWVAFPGGSAWHYCEQRNQWYMASFLPFQPDLNWRNPEVKEAMFDIVRYWLGLGVDGFRLDLFTALMKDEQLRDNPFRPGLYGEGLPRLYEPCMHHNHPDTFAVAKELRKVVDEFGEPERLLLGEVQGAKEDHRRLLGGESHDGLHLVFIFDMIYLLPWQRSAKWFSDVIRSFEEHLPEPLQPTYVFGNHDQRRLMSRFGDDPDFARVLALFQLTARGVPTVYMGEEIGMTDLFIPKADAQDPISKRFDWVPDWLRRLVPQAINRDANRTPMQWTGADNAGFCPPGVAPWLPVNAGNKHERNVESQLNDKGSLLNLYRDLLALRRQWSALRRGALDLLEGLPKTVLGYSRSVEGDRLDVLLNFGKRETTSPCGEQGEVLLATCAEARIEDGRILLPPKSGLIVHAARD